VRRWSHLERQQGGTGVRGGPGETQIELDKRMIGDRIKSTKERLEKVKKQRRTQSKSRERSGTFKVSLVGYTNAGKSTLFNALVKADTYVANQLFATLDTTTRSMYLQQVEDSVSLSDTVGFIRDLPHKLVEAFRATLQEAADADLLLHVIDAASPLLQEQYEEVQRVLHEIGADEVPQVLVYNKLDRLDVAQRPDGLVDEIEGERGVRTPRIFVSALNGEGLDALRQAIADALVASRESPQEDFECSLGIDASVRITYPPRTKHKTSTGLLARSNTVNVRQEVRIKNGRGSAIILAACERLFAETAVNRVRAFIKPHNDASLLAFSRAGFDRVQDVRIEGEAAAQFIFEREAA